MRPLILTLSLLMLAACDTGPSLNANVGISSGGIKVTPSVSGRVGGVGVSVTP